MEQPEIEQKHIRYGRSRLEDPLIINNPESIKPKFKFDFKKGVIAVGIILFLAIVFSQVNKPNKVEAKRGEIEAELAQAEEVASINLETATGLIQDAQRDLAELKKLTQNKRVISKTEELIDEYKKRIYKSKDSQSAEYFDLTVDDKQAEGTKLFLNNDNLYVLNPNGAIYELSIEKKSLQKHENPKITDAKQLAVFEDVTYFLKSDGIYSITDDKIEKTIAKDKSWNSPAGFETFAGNIYLLDPGAGNIFKYSPTEKGFGKISSYLQPGQKLEIDSPQFFTIDGAVYIANENQVMKFLNGFRASFTFDIPQDFVVAQIFTSEDLDKLFVLDKVNGKIFVLDKEGKYLKEIKADELKKAQDFVVSGASAYVLSSPKIFKIDL